MTQIANYLKKEFQYTDYQIGQLRYLYEVIVSELSKLIIMGIFFAILNQFSYYCFAVVVLLLLRTSTGGLHFNKYSSCFLFTLGFFFTAVVVLPHYLQTSRIIQLILLLACILINYYIGPIVSSRRKAPTQKLITKSRIDSFLVVFLYMMIVYIIPSNHYITVGFWVIILQTLQLIAACAKKRRKEENLS